MFVPYALKNNKIKNISKYIYHLFLLQNQITPTKLLGWLQLAVNVGILFALIAIAVKMDTFENLIEQGTLKSNVEDGINDGVSEALTNLDISNISAKLTDTISTTLANFLGGAVPETANFAMSLDYGELASSFSRVLSTIDEV